MKWIYSTFILYETVQDFDDNETAHLNRMGTYGWELIQIINLADARNLEHKRLIGKKYYFKQSGE